MLYEGDRVVLVNIATALGGEFNKSKSNTIGNKGTIISNFGSIRVQWNNGTSNSYASRNLALLDEDISTVNTGDE